MFVASILRQGSSALALTAILAVRQVLVLLHLPGRPCPALAATRQPCPGCGLTRATVALLHLDLATMARLHAFAPPVALAPGAGSVGPLLPDARRRAPAAKSRSTAARLARHRPRRS